jgi:hypothetical protein
MQGRRPPVNHDADSRLANRRAAQPVLSPTVPSLALRDGDFSRVSSLTLRDLNGTPFPNNRLPASRISPISLRLQEFYPAPNFGSPDLLAANFRGAFSARTKSDQFDVRLDHHLSSRHFFFSRFSFKNLKNGTVNFALPAIGPSRETPHVRIFALSDSFTFTPRLINEFRAGFSRQWRRIEGPFHGPTIIRQLGIEGLHPDLPDRPGFPQVAVFGFTTLSQAAFDNEFSGTVSPLLRSASLPAAAPKDLPGTGTFFPGRLESHSTSHTQLWTTLRIPSSLPRPLRLYLNL